MECVVTIKLLKLLNFKYKHLERTDRIKNMSL